MDGIDAVPDPGFPIRAADAADVARLYERYAQRLARLAEQHLSRRTAMRLDGEDVIQSVFRTFFRRAARGDFRIDSSEQIWRLLAKITLLKARAKGRYHTAAARAVGAEAPGVDMRLIEAATREPGPEEAATLSDEIERLLRGLPATFRDILEMRLEGCATTEIATALDVSRRTVERALNLLQERLSRTIADDRK
jgi:RNA polymerase sigma-70 factor (ECF subfamily)